MIVSITGGTGFIGKTLALRHLGMGDEVRVLSRKCEGLPEPVKWYKGDLLKEADLSSFVENADVLYHCAGQLSDISAMKSLHVDGTKRLAEAASGRIWHWVHLSSVGVYGPVSSGIVTEQFPLNPVGQYETTKCEADKIVLEASKCHAFTASILRPSNVFGGNMKNRSLFSMTKMIERGLFFFVGKPGASANYIHVDNVVEALILCATMPQARGRIYNLSDNRTMEEFVGLIASSLKKPPPKSRLPKSVALGLGKVFGKFPAFPLTVSRVEALSGFSVYSTMAIKTELQYRHVVSMEEGIEELVRVYRQCQK